MKRTALSAAALCITAAMAAEVKLPSLIADNMMLQQNCQATLWGSAAPNSQVTIIPSWASAATTTTADNDGKWTATVATPEASYDSYQITFADSESSTTVSGVIVGEVWLAAGQSNMQMPLKGFDGCCVQNGQDDAINASRDYPGVRMFNVPMKHSYTPQESCGGHWMTTQNFTDVMEFSATAFYFASNLSQALRVPVGIVNCSYGGTRVESWLPKEILDGYPDISTDSATIWASTPEYERPLVTYNAMFYPIRHYTVKGIIWYQGCSNVGSFSTYAERLATMVERWKTDMAQPELPFYYVEIAPYDYGSGDYASGARLREAQLKAESLIPNSAMTSTNDLAETFERYNIHPRRKMEVGHRLSYLALNLTYGMTQVCCFGPRYKSWRTEGNQAWVAFDHLDRGMCRNYDFKGFEIAGDDQVFYPADNAWLNWQTNEIVVTSDKVPAPAAVRYCFRDFQTGTVIGGNELPAVPFRTDDW